MHHYITGLDIAVGAPYEETGHGIVYIYNGYKDGLWPQYTQRIRGEQISSGILAFGCSFSRPLDFDSNGYNGKIYNVI
jgi:hypothetical protein